MVRERPTQSNGYGTDGPSAGGATFLLATGIVTVIAALASALGWLFG